MKQILIPTDFSENSWNAIQYALAFFKNIECDFYFLHVTLISNYGGSEFPLFPSAEVIDKTLLHSGKTALKSLVKKIKKQDTNPGHNFHLINTYNYFVDAVKEQIEEKYIDLIVMGTKGASGLSEIILGSNTGDIITQVKCPVLIVPEKAVFSIPKEIAFPTDYNIFYPSAILNYIVEFVKTYNSAIRILHVAKKDENLTDFQLENKNVVFIDDVLYTGRSIRSALTAIQSFGRPSEIELLTLIDRRFSRHLPIQPDYRGRQVDAINDEKVLVNWKETSGEDAVYLIKN